MSIPLFGIPFDDLTLDDAADRAMALLSGGGTHRVVTPNAEILQSARRSSAFRALLAGSDLILPDGAGVLLAARILGRPLPERIPGIDFAQALMDRLAAEGQPLFLLGARPGVAEEAAERLQRAHPGLVVCGTHHGYFADGAPIAAAVAQSGARVVFVCLGSPRQEEWMEAWGPSTGAGLLVGLGGSLDVFSGRVRRAPILWQRLGLEWLYRALREPARFRRVAALPRFIVSAVITRWKEKEGGVGHGRQTDRI